MKTTSIVAAFAALATSALAQRVVGAAEGFAKGVTGGGNAAPVYPRNINELVSYLGDSSPRVVVLRNTFDFRGTEGQGTIDGCAPWGQDSACQLALNKNDWCNGYQNGASLRNLRYDAASDLGITVNSHKTIIGEGNKGVIRGKGLRMVSGVSNIIIQNIAIEDLNPQYVWGGDGITINGADLIWIDHVTTRNIGRQHIVLGNGASGRVSITNCDIDGRSNWSATCNGHHYWGIYLTGSNDLITMKGNYIHHTSGRSPKVQGNTLLHAVNNYFYANTGHAFELASGGNVIAEGNAFQNVNEPMEYLGGAIFTVDNNPALCRTPLGRDCVRNAFGSSGGFPSRGGTGFFANFQGKNIASAGSNQNVPDNVRNNAGIGKI